MSKNMPRKSKLVKTDKDTKIVYYQTPVASFDTKKIVLDSGGWKTSSTKSVMNKFSSKFELGFSVFQKSKMWFIDFKGEILVFHDKITLFR